MYRLTVTLHSAFQNYCRYTVVIIKITYFLFAIFGLFFLYKPSLTLTHSLTHSAVIATSSVTKQVSQPSTNVVTKVSKTTTTTTTTTTTKDDDDDDGGDGDGEDDDGEDDDDALLRFFWCLRLRISSCGCATSGVLFVRACMRPSTVTHNLQSTTILASYVVLQGDGVQCPDGAGLGCVVTTVRAATLRRVALRCVALSVQFRRGVSCSCELQLSTTLSHAVTCRLPGRRAGRRAGWLLVRACER